MWASQKYPAYQHWCRRRARSYQVSCQNDDVTIPHELQQLRVSVYVLIQNNYYFTIVEAYIIIICIVCCDCIVCIFMFLMYASVTRILNDFRLLFFSDILYLKDICLYFQLTTCKADLKKSKDDLKKVKDELKTHKDCKLKLDETQKQLDALKKKAADAETEVCWKAFQFHLFRPVGLYSWPIVKR